MKVHGGDCSIVIKTAYMERDIPYSEETIREAVSLLQEEASIEGDGVCRVIRKKSGVTGCIVTPLTIGTAPLLLYLAMGSAGLPAFVRESCNLFRFNLDLLPFEDSDSFDLIQNRSSSNEKFAVGNERLLFECCRVKEFELRFNREEAVKLKIDVCGDRVPVVYPYADTFPKESGERYSGDNVTYVISGKKFSNIYGVTINAKKENGTKTEIWIKRVLEGVDDIPDFIDELVIEAKLLRDRYDDRQLGVFLLTLKRLVLVSDETNVNAVGAVMGSLRYYAAGVTTAVVCSANERL